MQLKFTHRLALVFAATLLFIFATNNKSGPSGGLTGAPGESNCTSCHSGSALNSGTGTLTIDVGGGLTAYTPGQTYVITVTMAQSGRSTFGFQSTALDGSNKMAGTLAVSSTTTTKKVTATISGAQRQYIEHNSGGISGSNQKSWSFNWTAPAAGTGTVKVYAAGNAANGNNNDSGDLIYTTSLTLSETVVAQPCTAAFSIQGASTGAAPFNVQFVDQSSNASTYAWTFIDDQGGVVGQSAQAAPSFSFTQAGTYSVKLKVSNSINSDSVTKGPAFITVNAAATPSFTANPLTGIAGQTLISFTANSPANTTAWNWNFGDGAGTSTVENPTYTYPTPGNFTVTLTRTTSGAQLTETRTAYISISPVVSIDPSRPLGFLVFPNPGTQVLNVRLLQAASQNLSLNLFDSKGQLILSQTLATGSTDAQLAVDNLPKGVYMLRLSDGNTSQNLQVLVGQ